MSARALPNTLVPLDDTEVAVELDHLNAHVAMELAAGLSTPAEIRTRYGINEAQWDRLKKSPIFRKMLADAVMKVRGDHNAGARIQLKADIVLEDAIPAYDRMIHDKEIPAAARIEAGKLLRDLAGRSGKGGDTTGPVGGGFVLNINLGGDKSVVIDGTTIPKAVE